VRRGHGASAVSQIRGPGELAGGGVKSDRVYQAKVQRDAQLYSLDFNPLVQRV
jgi:hypothetical protein